jgi:hypothetical protein
MSSARTDPILAAQPDPARAGPAIGTPAIPARWALLAGITGPVLLVAYFVTPALVGWPSAGESPDKLAAYATAHRLVFYLGGWLQATGALLSVVFLLVLLQCSGARRTLAGAAALTGCALLLSVVMIETAMLEAVPGAAANGDHATVATGFELASGVFVRIYPLAAAPLVFAGIGFALHQASILPRVFARTAVLIAGLFLIAGLAAVFGTAGLIFAIVMSVAEAVWIPAAAIAFARAGVHESRRRSAAASQATQPAGTG